MRLIRSLPTRQNIPNLSATIGNFEGLHLGHEKLINNTIKQAKSKNLKSAIITFAPHPANFFSKNPDKQLKILPLSQKLRLMKEKYQVDYVIILTFNEKLAHISPENFIEEILIKHLNVKHLTIGYDFTFGHKKSGNALLLKEYFQSNLDQIDKVEIDNIICSSSEIRKAIAQGEILKANQFLNKHYSITAHVSQNKKLGRKIGFNTANLVLNNQTIKPKYGVYKTQTTIHALNKTFKSITNYGVRPTIDDTKKEIFETHILDFNQDIYGHKITVEFLDFIRPEKKFNDIDDLKTQITQDIAKISL